MSFRTIILVLINLALFWGCHPQKGFKTISVLENQTEHQIIISYYRNGSLNKQNGVLINANETKEVLHSAENGKGPGMTYSTLLQGADFDSAIVAFDNNRKSVHYGYNKTGSNPNAVLYPSPRSIFNEENYTERIILGNKRLDEREFKYTFTEQDYLNAR